MKALLSNLSAQLDSLQALMTALEAESRALSKLDGEALRRLAMNKDAAAATCGKLQREARALIRRLHPSATTLRELAEAHPALASTLEAHRTSLEAAATRIAALNAHNAQAAQSARQIIGATLQDLGRKRGGGTYGPRIGGRR